MGNIMRKQQTGELFGPGTGVSGGQFAAHTGSIGDTDVDLEPHTTGQDPDVFHAEQVTGHGSHATGSQINIAGMLTSLDDTDREFLLRSIRNNGIAPLNETEDSVIILDDADTLQRFFDTHPSTPVPGRPVDSTDHLTPGAREVWGSTHVNPGNAYLTNFNDSDYDTLTVFPDPNDWVLLDEDGNTDPSRNNRPMTLVDSMRGHMSLRDDFGDGSVWVAVPTPTNSDGNVAFIDFDQAVDTSESIATNDLAGALRHAQQVMAEPDGTRDDRYRAASLVLAFGNLDEGADFAHDAGPSAARIAEVVEQLRDSGCEAILSDADHRAMVDDDPGLGDEWSKVQVGAGHMWVRGYDL